MNGREDGGAFSDDDDEFPGLVGELESVGVEGDPRDRVVVERDDVGLVTVGFPETARARVGVDSLDVHAAEGAALRPALPVEQVEVAVVLPAEDEADAGSERAQRGRNLKSSETDAERRNLRALSSPVDLTSKLPATWLTVASKSLRNTDARALIR